jgi:hypothetical protein
VVVIAVVSLDASGGAATVSECKSSCTVTGLAEVCVTLEMAALVIFD